MTWNGECPVLLPLTDRIWDTLMNLAWSKSNCFEFGSAPVPGSVLLLAGVMNAGQNGVKDQAQKDVDLNWRRK
jgi:hypothetical protein